MRWFRKDQRATSSNYSDGSIMEKAPKHKKNTDLEPHRRTYWKEEVINEREKERERGVKMGNKEDNKKANKKLKSRSGKSIVKKKGLE